MFGRKPINFDTLARQSIDSNAHMPLANILTILTDPNGDKQLIACAMDQLERYKEHGTPQQKEWISSNIPGEQIDAEG